MMILLGCLNYKLIGKDKSDFWEYLLPSVVVVSTHLTALFLMSVVFSKQHQFENKFGFLVMLIGPITHMCLNQFKYGSEKKGFYGILMMHNYYIVLMSQGIMFGIW